MKYIKKFFESDQQSIPIESLEDALLEFHDMGLCMTISEYNEIPLRVIPRDTSGNATQYPNGYKDLYSENLRNDINEIRPGLFYRLVVEPGDRRFLSDIVVNTEDGDTSSVIKNESLIVDLYENKSIVERIERIFPNLIITGSYLGTVGKAHFLHPRNVNRGDSPTVNVLKIEFSY